MDLPLATGCLDLARDIRDGSETLCWEGDSITSRGGHVPMMILRRWRTQIRGVLLAGGGIGRDGGSMTGSAIAGVTDAIVARYPDDGLAGDNPSEGINALGPDGLTGYAPGQADIHSLNAGTTAASDGTAHQHRLFNATPNNGEVGNISRQYRHFFGGNWLDNATRTVSSFFITLDHPNGVADLILDARNQATQGLAGAVSGISTVAATPVLNKKSLADFAAYQWGESFNAYLGPSIQIRLQPNYLTSAGTSLVIARAGIFVNQTGLAHDFQSKGGEGVDFFVNRNDGDGHAPVTYVTDEHFARYHALVGTTCFVMCCGANDAGRHTIANWKATVEEYIDRRLALVPGCRILLIGAYDIPTWTNQLSGFNNAMYELARAYPTQVLHLNLFEAFGPHQWGWQDRGTAWVNGRAYGGGERITDGGTLYVSRRSVVDTAISPATQWNEFNAATRTLANLDWFQVVNTDLTATAQYADEKNNALIDGTHLGINGAIHYAEVSWGLIEAAAQVGSVRKSHPLARGRVLVG